MRRLADERRLVIAAAAGILALGLAACGSGSSGSGGGSSSTNSSATLTMESSPESTITQAFNPFVTTQAAYGMGATGLIYEPLIQFDLANPTVSYPWLATSYKWGNSGKQITFTIRSGVKWSNGSALTPADVAYTFDLVKANTSINLGGLTISSVSTSGNTVTLTFPSPQYTNLEEIAGTAIVPKAIWSKAGNPATYADANPVGTGPVHAAELHPAGVHAEEEPQLLAGLQGQGGQGLLPGLHLQHRRPQRAVLRADHLDRQLHPRPAEAVRRQGARPTTTTGRPPAVTRASSPT